MAQSRENRTDTSPIGSIAWAISVSSGSIITGGVIEPVIIEPDETEIAHAIDPIGEVSVRFSRD